MMNLIHKMRVGKTSCGTWQVAGQDYYCEFPTFTEAISEAHRVFDEDWVGDPLDYDWDSFFTTKFGGRD
jgi:hypothetical protein